MNADDSAALRKLSQAFGFKPRDVGSDSVLSLVNHCINECQTANSEKELAEERASVLEDRVRLAESEADRAGKEMAFLMLGQSDEPRKPIFSNPDVKLGWTLHAAYHNTMDGEPASAFQQACRLFNAGLYAAVVDGGTDGG